MKLNVTSKNTLDTFQRHLMGKRISLMFSEKIHTLFYPYTVFQIPFELYLSIHFNDEKDNSVSVFAIRGIHFESPDDGWKEIFNFEIHPTELDLNKVFDKYSVLNYKTAKNSEFLIHSIEYYCIPTEIGGALFAVRFVESEEEQILISHHGFGNGLELLIGKTLIDSYFKENPFGKKLVRYQ